jgi:hypothetical protein
MVLSSSERACFSSGFDGFLAKDRIRRYEEKRGRLDWSVDRTSLMWSGLLACACALCVLVDGCLGGESLTLGLGGMGRRAPWLWFWEYLSGGSRSVDWDSESELLASPCIIHDHVFGVFGGWKRRA